jgi:hypothetical protein
VAIILRPSTLWSFHDALKRRKYRLQIIETIEVAIEMGGGPTLARSSFALKVLEYYKEHSPICG